MQTNKQRAKKNKRSRILPSLFHAIPPPSVKLSVIIFLYFLLSIFISSVQYRIIPYVTLQFGETSSYSGVVTRCEIKTASEAMPKYHTSYRSYITLCMDNGLNASVFQDVAARSDLIEALVGTEVELRYSASNAFGDDSHILLSVSANGEVLLREKDVLDSYAETLSLSLNVLLIVAAVCVSFVALSTLVCWLWRLKKLLKKQKEKQRKKARNKRLSEKGKSASAEDSSLDL